MIELLSRFESTQAIFSWLSHTNPIRVAHYYLICLQTLPNWKSKIWNLLTLSQMTNFRLFQTEKVGRRQFQIWCKRQKVLQTGKKRCGKWRNCSLRAISSFPKVFSKDLYCRQVSKDWRSWKSHWWRDLDILGLIDGHHPFTWQSCFYVIETALENRAERKKNSFFLLKVFLQFD